MGKKKPGDPSTSRLSIFQGADDLWYWKCTSGNGFIVAVGGEGFSTEAGVKKAVERAITCIGEAEAHPLVKL